MPQEHSDMPVAGLLQRDLHRVSVSMHRKSQFPAHSHRDIHSSCSVVPGGNLQCVCVCVCLSVCVSVCVSVCGPLFTLRWMEKCHLGESHEPRDTLLVRKEGTPVGTFTRRGHMLGTTGDNGWRFSEPLVPKHLL